MLGQLRKTAGSPESGLPASNINAADCYSNLSATAEIINTSSARGTAALTLKVKPSLFSCVNISTEISECLELASLLLQVLTSARLLAAVGPLPFYGAKMNTRTAFHPFSGIPGVNSLPTTTGPAKQEVKGLLDLNEKSA